MHAHAHADNLHVHAHVNGVVQCQPWKSPRSTIGMYGERITNAPCPCPPSSTVETFGEEISAEACSGKEIAGLLRKMIMMMMMMMMMMNLMTRKLCNRGFSRGKLEAGRNELGLCTARYESKSCC